jgi:aldose 1-epimerase
LAVLACSGAQQEKPAVQAAPVAAAPAPAPPAGATAEPEATAKTAITKESYGKTDGKEVFVYTLVNDKGMTAKIINYGGILSELHVPDKSGKTADVVLGFENFEGYQKNGPYFGATIGRVANRVKDHKFELEGKKYTLAANNGPHSLHGGVKGWDKVVWDATPKETPAGPSLELTYVSKDGEEGYPGTVTATTIYTLTNDNELRVDMQAVTDKPTVVSMAHHSYWNLGGFGSGTILDHELTLFADKYTPGDPVPDGKVKAVKGTPFDFTTAKAIGKDLKAAGGKPVGFDANWVVNGEPSKMRPVAKVRDPKSGRVMTIEADQPGVQFYTGNYLDGTVKGKGATYAQYAGLCLETQKFPNSVNVPAWKNEVLLKPGQTYKHAMVHRFSVE